MCCTNHILSILFLLPKSLKLDVVKIILDKKTASLSLVQNFLTLLMLFKKCTSWPCKKAGFQSIILVNILK